MVKGKDKEKGPSANQLRGAFVDYLYTALRAIPTADDLLPVTRRPSTQPDRPYILRQQTRIPAQHQHSSVWNVSEQRGSLQAYSSIEPRVAVQVGNANSR